MTAPVQNNAPQNDSYGDYDTGYTDDEYNYDDQQGTDSFGTGDLGDDFVPMDGSEGDGQAQFQSPQDMRNYIQNVLLPSLQASGLKPEEKKHIKEEIKALMGQINHAFVYKGGEALSSAMSAIAVEIGNIENEIHPPQGDPSAGGSGSTADEINKFIEDVKANTNLNDQQKEDFTTKAQALLDSLKDLNPDDEMAGKIEDQFMELKDKYDQDSQYPSGVGSLSELLDIDPEVLQKVLAQYGIDPKDPSSVTKENFEKLLNDPEFGGELYGYTSAVAQGTHEVDANYAAAVSQATQINNANQLSDTSQQDSMDWTPFKTINDIHNHKDPKSEEITQNLKDGATLVAKIYTALTGKEASAGDPAGTVTLDGEAMCIMADMTTSDIKFGDASSHWPQHDLVSCYLDREGDGQTEACPSWMEESNYPIYEYDNTGQFHTTHEGYAGGFDGDD